MLDVVLYRIDRRGRIDLLERAFPTLTLLAEFFSSGAGEPWAWAEVHLGEPPRICRYYAHELTRMVGPLPDGSSETSPGPAGGKYRP